MVSRQQRRGDPGQISDTALAILDIYRSFDIAVANEDLYREFGDASQSKKVTLPDYHFRETSHSGRSAYVHLVRSYVSGLRRDGYLKQVDRGVYRITQKGLQSLKEIPPSIKWLHRDATISPGLRTNYRLF